MSRWLDEPDQPVDWEARYRSAKTEEERNLALLGALKAGVATLDMSSRTPVDPEDLPDPLPQGTSLDDTLDDDELDAAVDRIAARALARLRAK